MKRPLKLGLIALVAVLVVGGAALLARQRRPAPPPPAAKAEQVLELAATDVARAEQRELTQGLPISGSLKALNSAVVKARAAGELQGLAVREGDAVRAGQVLARIDAPDARSRVKQASEQADSAKAQIDIAQRQWNNNKALVDQGFISKTALETSWNNLVAAEANHKAALAAVDMARKGLDDTVLVAPIAGQIAQRLAQNGERVGIEARIVEIVDPSRLELEATLAAADSVQLRVGQTARLAIEGRAEPVEATVARINPAAQAASRSVLAYLSVAPAAGLRHGLFAQGQLALGQVRALAVPLSAVRTDKPAPYVQVVEQGRIRHLPVQLGPRGSAGRETVVAAQGVPEGALVLQGHLGMLREGTAVRFTGTPPPSAPAGKLPSP